MRFIALVVGMAAMVGCGKKSGDVVVVDDTTQTNSSAKYSLKRVPVPPGSKLLVKSSSRTIVLVRGKDGAPDHKIVESEKAEYIERVLAETDGKPTKLARAYQAAQFTENNVPRDRAYAGKEVVIERKNDLYSFTMDGRPLNAEDAKRLRAELSNPSRLGEKLFPGGPVGVGDSWPLDAKAMEEFSQTRDTPIDIAKSSFIFKLTKVYKDSDGKEWAVIEGTLTLAPGAHPNTDVQDVGTLTGTMTLETPTDGKSADRSITFSAKAPITSKVNGELILAEVEHEGNDICRVTADANDVRNVSPQLKDQDPAKRLAAIRKMIELKKVETEFPTLLTLLDDKDRNVQLAAAEALGQVKTPSMAAIDAINQALASGYKNAKQFSLIFYASDITRKVPENLLPAVAAILSDPSADNRKAALRVLSQYGPGCKSKAMAAVFDLTADDDAAIAAEASKLFASFAPFDETARPTLAARLKHEKAAIRLAAVTILSGDAPDAATALEWFRPRISDEDPRIRAKALEALARWGAKAKECLPAILPLLKDANVELAVAALKAAVAIDGGNGILKDLTPLIQAGETRAAVKAAAMEVVLTLDLSDASALPILSSLLEADKPATRAGALDRLAKLGPAAKPALDAITNRLKDDDPGVRLAAVRAIAPFGVDAAAAIPSVAVLLDEKQPDAVTVAAAETLGKMGPKAIDPLAKSLTRKLSKDALVRVCESLGGFGKEAEAVGPALLGAAMNQKSLRPFLNDSTEQPWKPDPVALAIVKIGGDAVVKQLVDWMGFELKTVGGKKERVATYGDAVMLWAVLVMGTFDPDSLSEKARKQASSQLDTLASYAPTPACKTAAKASLAKFSKKK